jgi:predicted nucleic acid-binding protein
MSEAITDTGPVLHLYEIGRWESLRIFDRLIMPDLVVEELHACGVALSRLKEMGMQIITTVVERKEWTSVLSEFHQPLIQPADAQVFVLARASQFQKTVLTDDLALRRHLEGKGTTVVGSVGVLVRAYKRGKLKRDELESAVDALFHASTLHASHAFKAYVRQLLADMP